MNIQAPRDFIDRRQLVSALRALRRGDFSVRLPEEVDGVDGEIASIFNEVVSLNEEMTQEFERLSKVVGKEGKITQRGRVKNARGGWETAIRSVNELIGCTRGPQAWRALRGWARLPDHSRREAQRPGENDSTSGSGARQRQALGGSSPLSLMR